MPQILCPTRVIPKSGDMKGKCCERNELNKVRFSVANRDYNWGNLLTINEPLVCYAKFSVDLYRLVNENFSIKASTKKYLDVVEPYITKKIKTLIRKKHKMQILFSENPTRCGIDYLSFRNLVTSKIRKANSYHKRQLELNSSDCKGL